MERFCAVDVPRGRDKALVLEVRPLGCEAVVPSPARCGFGLSAAGTVALRHVEHLADGQRTALGFAQRVVRAAGALGIGSGRRALISGESWEAELSTALRASLEVMGSFVSRATAVEAVVECDVTGAVASVLCNLLREVCLSDVNAAVWAAPGAVALCCSLPVSASRLVRGWQALLAFETNSAASCTGGDGRRTVCVRLPNFATEACSSSESDSEGEEVTDRELATFAARVCERLREMDVEALLVERPLRRAVRELLTPHVHVVDGMRDCCGVLGIRPLTVWPDGQLAQHTAAIAVHMEVVAPGVLAVRTAESSMADCQVQCLLCAPARAIAVEAARVFQKAVRVCADAPNPLAVDSAAYAAALVDASGRLARGTVAHRLLADALLAEAYDAERAAKNVSPCHWTLCATAVDAIVCGAQTAAVLLRLSE